MYVCGCVGVGVCRGGVTARLTRRQLVRLLFFLRPIRPPGKLDILKQSKSIWSSVPLPDDRGIACVLLELLYSISASL